MKNKCLYCCKELEGSANYHKECMKEFFGTEEEPLLEYTLDKMVELAKNVVERSISVPGVQAKLSMSLVSEAVETSDKRLTIVSALGGNYILKPPTKEFPEMTANEHITMLLAREMEIQTVPSSLIRLRSGELAYITKRVDRDDSGIENHMLDMFQITEAVDKYKSSCEKIAKAVINYSDISGLDTVRLLELLIFSFLTGNNDMHLKNFSLINSPLGWQLSPAYDLLNVTIILPEDNEELALSLEAKKRKLSKQHFDKLGKSMGLSEKQIDNIHNRFKDYSSHAIDIISKSFLSPQMQERYSDLLKSRYVRLYGNIFDEESLKMPKGNIFV